jgi:alpha-beta hydrolase superfamily lysophospholipase
MGGGIVLSFLERSRLADRVRAAVLDAPAVDFGTTVDLGIRLARLPAIDAPLPPLTGVLAKGLASFRFGVDWREYGLLRHADRIRAPLLVFHGDEDDVVPFEGSTALAAARPDLVTFERFHGARHLESWNLDRIRYESDVAAFLRSPSVLGPESRE